MVYKRSTLVYYLGKGAGSVRPWKQLNPRKRPREEVPHVRRRGAQGKAHPDYGRRDRAWQGDGGWVRCPWRPRVHLRAAGGNPGPSGRGQGSALLANVRDPDSIEAMMTSIWEEGPLTSLVNNAAANFLAPTESLS